MSVRATSVRVTSVRATSPSICNPGVAGSTMQNIILRTSRTFIF